MSYGVKTKVGKKRAENRQRFMDDLRTQVLAMAAELSLHDQAAGTFFTKGVDRLVGDVDKMIRRHWRIVEK